jgi:hypothetical protein
MCDCKDCGPGGVTWSRFKFEKHLRHVYHLAALASPSSSASGHAMPPRRQKWPVYNGGAAADDEKAGQKTGALSSLM